jgi:predicted  nucleic acid-binding Zn-ribbon protein
MPNKKADVAAQVDSSQEVDRIRDIIFGSQIKDYEQRFQNVQRDLNRLQQEFDQLNEQLTDQGSDHNKKVQNLRREMRQADDGLRDELRETAQTLSQDKVDRMALGDLFVELGNHLKNGGSLADLLKGLDGKSE